MVAAPLVLPHPAFYGIIPHPDGSKGFCYGAESPCNDMLGVRPFYSEDATSEQFRIIMAGILIDLIRLSSTAADDISFWNGLIDYIDRK